MDMNGICHICLMYSYVLSDQQEAQDDARWIRIYDHIRKSQIPVDHQSPQWFNGNELGYTFF